MEWKKSRAHHLLLSKFLTPSGIENLLTDIWEKVLLEKPMEAIKRFYQQGLIAQPAVSERLSIQFDVSSLKTLLKERGLKVSGKKVDLVARLIESDAQGMQRLTANLKIFQCSAEGKSIAEKYLAFEKQYRARVEIDVTGALQKGDFKKAALLVADYESKQVFKRGLWVGSSAGSHWDNYNPTEDIEALTPIFNSQPQVLSGLTMSQLNLLRLAAGLMYLWGSNNATEWIPADFTTDLGKDNNAIASMLYSHAMYLRTLNRYRESGVKRVRIVTVNDEHVCSACQKLADKIFSIEKVPELPYPKCSCELGCRCFVRPQM